MPTQLSVPIQCGGRKTYGYCTPEEDRAYQKMVVPPRRVIPIVFIPGIMGSNLRMTSARQLQLKKKNNIAWRPDNATELGEFSLMSAADRQLQLDPHQTVVDTFGDGRSPTGDKDESSLNRHVVGQINVFIGYESHSPLLTNDPPTANPRYLVADKVRQRGWSEVFLSSYRNFLENCEKYLNSSVDNDRWRSIIDRSPVEWAAVPDYGLAPLTKAEYLGVMTNCFFPVHAMGYNWLQDNELSAVQLCKRVVALIQKYQKAEFQCKKVILVTHSMGGLVARAMIHPAIGGLGEKVLGIVHGVMPALGSPAAYKRMRSGFEQDTPQSFAASFPLGHTGSRVTAVLGNSAGGLQLLPCKAYGNGWLEVRHKKALFGSLPQKGDPYEEIYKTSNRWYGLLREEWLNPARVPHAGLAYTKTLLDIAKHFHDQISETYHPNTYAHYGVDSERPSWEKISWHLNTNFSGVDWNDLSIESDNEQGTLTLTSIPKYQAEKKLSGTAVLGPSTGKGDQTVPSRSSDHQFLNAALRGVFRQSGYEHQSSYSNEQVLNATLYSIVKIAQQMTWPE
jgi:hypothetical protein